MATRAGDNAATTMKSVVAGLSAFERSPIEWHGVEVHCPDWSGDPNSLAISLQSLCVDMLLRGTFKTCWEPLTFALPSTKCPQGESKPWRRWIDTAIESPEEITPWEAAPAVMGEGYTLQPRSAVALVRRAQTGKMAGT